MHPAPRRGSGPGGRADGGDRNNLRAGGTCQVPVDNAPDAFQVQLCMHRKGDANTSQGPHPREEDPPCLSPLGCPAALQR